MRAWLRAAALVLFVGAQLSGGAALAGSRLVEICTNHGIVLVAASDEVPAGNAADCALCLACCAALDLPRLPSLIPALRHAWQAASVERDFAHPRVIARPRARSPPRSLDPRS